MSSVPASWAGIAKGDTGLRRCREGALWLDVAGALCALRPSGALWLAAARTLVVADLHFEKGSAYARRGQLLPPYDTRATLDRLEAEIAATQPARLVLLGDSFHDAGAAERLDPADAQRIARLAWGRTLVWVVGNHDAEGLSSFAGEIADVVEVCGLSLRHDPLPGAAPGEVAGHLHPCAKVAGTGGVVRRRAFVTDGERLILPAFGAYAGGLNVLDMAFAALFSRMPLACALGRSQVHPIVAEALRGD